MYVDSVTFWTTVLSGIIIGLVVGGILGGFGFYIWKRQHLYSKKLDAYTSFMNILYEFVSLFGNGYENKNLFINDETRQIFKSFLRHKLVFIHYFGRKYHNTIFELSTLFLNLKKGIDIKMTKEEMDIYVSERVLIIEDLKFK